MTKKKAFAIFDKIATADPDHSWEVVYDEADINIFQYHNPRLHAVLTGAPDRKQLNEWLGEWQAAAQKSQQYLPDPAKGHCLIWDNECNMLDDCLYGCECKCSGCTETVVKYARLWDLTEEAIRDGEVR